jgi:hypothetical protein
MENLYIEFSVQGLDAGLFFLNFVQKHGRFNSSFFPIFVIWKEFPPINYLILEANEDPLQEPREIAKMSFTTLDSESKVVIEVIGDGRNRWYTVEKLVQTVLEDLWNKDYRINSVFPRGLLHPAKVGCTKKELIGEYIEGELITEEIQSTPGLPEEVDQSGLEGSESSNPIIHVPENLETNFQDLSLMNGVDPYGDNKKYGTDRDISGNQIRSFVHDCRLYQKSEGSIKRFYYEELADYHNKFAFETFRTWLKDPKFKPK